MKLKYSSDLRWNSHCGHGRKTILNYGIDTILQFLYHGNILHEDHANKLFSMIITNSESIKVLKDN